MGFNPFSNTLALGLLATTGPSGFALQNATPNILTWTAPNDGNMHRFIVIGGMHVTSAATGGAIILSAVNPDGSTSVPTLIAASQGAGATPGMFNAHTVEAGSTVTVAQTALTAGAATVWAELWGS